MDNQSRQHVGVSCQSAAWGRHGTVDTPARLESTGRDRPERRGYYTHRAGEGIVFVPYGVSPVAK